MTLAEYYKSIKEKPRKELSKKDRVIVDCFCIGLFKLRPTKEDKQKFSAVFDIEYPKTAEDITPNLQKRLANIVSLHKLEDKEEQKAKKQRAERGFADSDCYDMASWFMNIMPQMLQTIRDNTNCFPDAIASVPGGAHGVQMPDEEEHPAMKEWKETLDRMIFLLQEMNEETCSYKNKYAEKYEEMNHDFRKKYGFLGEGLKSEEEKAKEKEKGLFRMYCPTDFPDLYPDAMELHGDYMRGELNKRYYIDRCREEFFMLFSKNFWDLVN